MLNISIVYREFTTITTPIQFCFCLNTQIYMILVSLMRIHTDLLLLNYVSAASFVFYSFKHDESSSLSDQTITHRNWLSLQLVVQSVLSLFVKTYFLSKPIVPNASKNFLDLNYIVKISVGWNHHIHHQVYKRRAQCQK